MYAALYAYNGGVINVGGDSTKSVIITSTSDGINAVNLEKKGAAFVSVKASESVSIVSMTLSALWAFKTGNLSLLRPRNLTAQ